MAKDSALVVSAQGAVYFVRLQNGIANAQPADVAPQPDGIAISASASYGAVYYREERSIAILKLSDRAQAMKRIVMPGPADAVAISDDGTALAVALNGSPGCSSRAMRSHSTVHPGCAGSDATGLRVMNTATGEWRTVAQRSYISSIAFLPSSKDLVYADEKRGLVTADSYSSGPADRAGSSGRGR